MGCTKVAGVFQRKTEWLAMAFLICASGCGLSDYQTRMDAQRVRIQEIDETNELLDDPIEMPTLQNATGKEDKLAWSWRDETGRDFPVDVFLRLPKGFGTVPKDKNPYYTNFSFFRYAGAEPGFNIFLVAAFIAEADAKQGVSKYHPKSFRFYVRKSIEDYYVKTTKFNLVLPEKVEDRSETFKRLSHYPSDARPIVYTYYEYRDTNNNKTKDHSSFRVYLHQEGDRQVCLVDQRPLRSPNEAHDKAVTACLRTLDVSDDAAIKRRQFRKATLR